MLGLEQLALVELVDEAVGVLDGHVAVVVAHAGLLLEARVDFLSLRRIIRISVSGFFGHNRFQRGGSGEGLESRGQKISG